VRGCGTMSVRSRGRRLAAWCTVAALMLAATFVVLLRLDPYGERVRLDAPWPPERDQALAASFSDESIPAPARFERLFSYFVTGFLHYRTPDMANADYPGAPSRNGTGSDRLEGFSRLAPLVASWLAAGRPEMIADLSGKAVHLPTLIRVGLLAGTDATGPGYWGRVGDRDQRIVEAADVALTVWLVRDTVWQDLTLAQRDRVIAWLDQVHGRAVPDTNWHLFAVLVGEVTRALGYPVDRAGVDAHYARLKSFYRGAGWFSDGPGGRFDFYNAWGIHYSLFWLDRINPALDRTFIREASDAFLASYVQLMTPVGIPILGRSVCYRMAAPAPLVAGALNGSPAASPGLARRGLYAVWRWFIAQGGVARGSVTQGYCGTDLRFLDNYSGPASCLWSLRSLILGIFAPADQPLWHAPEEPLPVERGDFRVAVPEIGWEIEGVARSSDVRVHRPAYAAAPSAAIEGYTALHKLAELVLWRPVRPRNTGAKYQQATYSAREPFCGCVR
jgi:hypothetical protein